MVDLRSLILIFSVLLLVPASTSIGKKKPVSCYDKLVKLIKKSNFLEASGLYDGEAGKYLKLTKKELKKAAFDTEFDDSARFIIHVYMKSPKDVSMELRTIGWLSIDSGKKQLAVMRYDQEDYAPVKCDSSLLNQVIHCIDWSDK